MSLFSIFLFLFIIGSLVLGFMIGVGVERKKHQAEQIPERRRQVCYYPNGQIWQMGRHMEVGMMVCLKLGGELLPVQRDVHFYVVDPATDERVWLIYG